MRLSESLRGIVQEASGVALLDAVRRTVQQTLSKISPRARVAAFKGTGTSVDMAVEFGRGSSSSTMETFEGALEDALRAEWKVPDKVNASIVNLAPVERGWTSGAYHLNLKPLRIAQGEVMESAQKRTLP